LRRPAGDLDENFPIARWALFKGPVRFCCSRLREKSPARLELVPAAVLILPDANGGPCDMLVERGMRVMNTEVVGDAYAIASNYLRRSGALPDNFVTSDRLLTIIVQLFQGGEANRLKLANKAIAAFEQSRA
jgi:hypothetical protein